MFFERSWDEPNNRIEIKIPDPSVNQTRAAELEGRDSTDHATATDSIISKLRKMNFNVNSTLLQVC